MATTPRRWSTLVAAFALAAAFAAGLALAPFQPEARAGAEEALAASAGTFTGEDDTGDFQLALDDAVNQAVAAAGCCDIQVNFEVLDIKGRVGGFIGEDKIFVRIYAKW